jgi:hypothetical protein
MSLFSNKSKNNSGFGFQYIVKTPIPQSIISQPQTQLQPEVNKMKWGEPTWFLFHTLCYKLKDEYFLQIKNDFLNICFIICRNLPCPTCAEHATQYVQNINVNAIQNKQQMKDLFFEFHNMVNKRKGFAIYNKNDLDDKYSKAITVAIIQNFIYHFRDKSRSIRNIANDFFREKSIVQINQWFSKNLQYFNL